MTAYYNEFDQHAADWLRNLIQEGLIADGVVDERPIQEVKKDDLEGFTQAHFFAGIGGWSYALRLAGWSDDRPVWTGSCPCQSFSVAGKREGASDERHLWPEWYRLIAECQPPTVFGEQVVGAIGFGWLDAVATDLEANDYAFGSAVLSGFVAGAYHKRQRLWFVADTDQSGREARNTNGVGEKSHKSWNEVQFENESADLADPKCKRLQGGKHKKRSRSQKELFAGRSFECANREPGQLGHANGGRSKKSSNATLDRNKKSEVRETDVFGGGSPPDWEQVQWLECADGKTRPIPVEPGLQPLVNGLPTVVDREGNSHKYSYTSCLKAVGNAIIPQVAAEFIRAYCDDTNLV